MNITYGDIMQVIQEKLTATFGYPVYSDEVREGFRVPCFFLKLIPISSVETLNTIRTNLTIVITYFGRQRNYVEYMDIENKVRDMLDIGFSVKDRYVHVDTVTDNRTGDHEDILQIEVDVSYANQSKRMIQKIEDEKDPDKLVESVQTHMNYDGR